jgi:hypothetical protein
MGTRPAALKAHQFKKGSKRVGEQHGPVDDMGASAGAEGPEPEAVAAAMPPAPPRPRRRNMVGHHAQMGTLRVHGGKLA